MDESLYMLKDSRAILHFLGVYAPAHRDAPDVCAPNTWALIDCMILTQEAEVPEKKKTHFSIFDLPAF